MATPVLARVFHLFLLWPVVAHIRALARSLVTCLQALSLFHPFLAHRTNSLHAQARNSLTTLFLELFFFLLFLCVFVCGFYSVDLFSALALPRSLALGFLGDSSLGLHLDYSMTTTRLLVAPPLCNAPAHCAAFRPTGLGTLPHFLSNDLTPASLSANVRSTPARLFDCACTSL